MTNSLNFLKSEAASELTENILPFWLERMIDPNGGFYGRIDGNGKLCADAPRGGILTARILWTFASAYRLLGREEYLRAALLARDEIRDRFFDKENGGTYWSLDAQRNPLDTKKQIYAIAFTVYGLSELYRAIGDQGSLELAIELYRSIEKYSFDNVLNGYLEAFTKEWNPIEDMRLSEKDQNDAKTMNTHLHVLEGYTSLYRVWKDAGLQKQLKNLIEVFLDRILLPDGHLALFFSEDWSNTSHVTSYGHDIECAWLLAEAAEVLGDEALLKRVKSACAQTAVAALEGWSAEGGMIYERDIVDGETDADRHWWVQAETVVGCLWQWKYRKAVADSTAAGWLEKSVQEWAFIKQNIINPEGEWYWSLRADGTPNREDDLAGFWKCPYHNGRMCMEILQMNE